jgi:hypothetical protein
MVAPPSENPRSRKRALTRSVRLPMVSGKASALVLAACLLLTAGCIIPMAWGLPRWIDFEIVLAAWWVIWAAALARLLYGGHRISDDHVLAEPRNWFRAVFGGSGDKKKKSGGGSSGGSSGWSLLDGLGGAAEFEGCLVGIGVVLALFVAFVGFWLLIEIVIPGIAFFMYFIIRGMLARVANDDHGCAGNWLRATLWGAFWATVYVAPLALLVWLAHEMLPGKV